ncbi:hypothetical protein [Caballeronia sp. GAFFF1]|uniref:hypothetical protein n=1 Tax=Caballeronia sp. GAFFF1 TaxID=2921779 RepID=UPI0020286549|nr:hypothetical protein [Caballeronia sp. GAFFF1]
MYSSARLHDRLFPATNSYRYRSRKNALRRSIPAAFALVFLVLMLYEFFFSNSKNTLSLFVTGTFTGLLTWTLEAIRQRAAAASDFESVLDLFDKIYEDPMSSTALKLLDYESYPVTFPKPLGEETKLIGRKEMLGCLRVDNLRFSEEEMYIRDCFDVLFVNATKLALLYNRSFVNMSDVAAMFGFFFARMRRDDQPPNNEWIVFKTYLEAFRYTSLITFVDEFWQEYAARYSEGIVKDHVVYQYRQKNALVSTRRDDM